MDTSEQKGREKPIFEVLKYILAELNHLEKDILKGEDELAFLEDIARIEGKTDTVDPKARDGVILTLVNIEVEKTHKNSPHYFREGDTIVKRNPTLFLNLYVLFSCTVNAYDHALMQLSRIVSFFQKKHVFTVETDEVNGFPRSHTEKIIIELCSMNFEQMNHLWGILGGKYTPSVLYKLRLIPIQESPSEKVSLVEEIKADSNQKN